MNNDQNNSIFARMLRSKTYMVVWFSTMYLWLFFLGSGIFIALGMLPPERRKIWPPILITALIIIVSSLLTKMLLGRKKELKIREKIEGIQK